MRMAPYLKPPKAMRFAVLALCALVLFLGAWEKISAYKPQASVTATSSLKLWLDSDKRASQYAAQTLTHNASALQWLSFVFALPLPLIITNGPTPIRNFGDLRSPQYLALLGFHRFRRPPPVL
jgi:hypothetical protein